MHQNDEFSDLSIKRWEGKSRVQYLVSSIGRVGVTSGCRQLGGLDPSTAQPSRALSPHRRPTPYLPQHIDKPLQAPLANWTGLPPLRYCAAIHQPVDNQNRLEVPGLPINFTSDNKRRVSYLASHKNISCRFRRFAQVVCERNGGAIELNWFVRHPHHIMDCVSVRQAASYVRQLSVSLPNRRAVAFRCEFASYSSVRS